MSKQFTRREFLKTTGAAVLAVAAAGALSACGGGGGDSGYIPNPSPDTARKLGNLTFNIAGYGYPFKHEYLGHDDITVKDEYCQYYIPVLSVENTAAQGTSGIPLRNAEFSLRLENNAAVVSADDESGAFVDEDMKKMSELTVEPGQTVKGYVGYVRKTQSQEDFQIAYLTIKYAGQQVTYKFDGHYYTASSVTNA